MTLLIAIDQSQRILNDLSELESVSNYKQTKRLGLRTDPTVTFSIVIDKFIILIHKLLFKNSKLFGYIFKDKSYFFSLFHLMEETKKYLDL